jgi:hypothetical protein
MQFILSLAGLIIYFNNLYMYLLFTLSSPLLFSSLFAFWTVDASKISRSSGASLDAIVLILGNVDFMNWICTKFSKIFPSAKTSSSAVNLALASEKSNHGMQVW